MEETLQNRLDTSVPPLTKYHLELAFPQIQVLAEMSIQLLALRSNMVEQLRIDKLGKLFEGQT